MEFQLILWSLRCRFQPDLPVRTGSVSGPAPELPAGLAAPESRPARRPSRRAVPAVERRRAAGLRAGVALGRSDGAAPSVPLVRRAAGFGTGPRAGAVVVATAAAAAAVLVGVVFVVAVAAAAAAAAAATAVRLLVGWNRFESPCR